jgi:hypothetical protein
VAAACRPRPRPLLLGLSTYEEICLLLPVVSDLAQRLPTGWSRVRSNAPLLQAAANGNHSTRRDRPCPCRSFLKTRSALPDRLAVGAGKVGGRCAS